MKSDNGKLCNPYLDGKRLWNDHVGRVIAARSLWQLVALLSLLLALAGMGTVAHIATRSRFVPYVVEVDQVGNVEAVKRAAAMAPAKRDVIVAQLGSFITLARRVTTDIALQGAAVKGTLAMLAEGDPATQKMASYYMGDGHPVHRAREVTVTTEIHSTLPLSADTWQVDWLETVYNRQGELQERVPMRAYLEVYQSEPKATDEEALRANPLSIYVRDFNWTRREAREVQQ